jgi:hypothetical protein
MVNYNGVRGGIKMSISASEIKLYRSAVVNNITTNGGRMSTTEVVTNVLNNLFPNVTQAERTAGVTRYRKAYCKLHDSGDETLYNHRSWMKTQSPAGDYVQVKAGTNTDTQAQADDYTNWLGCGRLNTAESADSTSIEVLFETNSGVGTPDATNTQLCWISDGTNEEFINVTAVSWASNTATLTLQSGLQYSYDTYGNAGTVVAGVVDFGDTTSSVDNIVVTSSSGTFDNTYLTVANIGTVEDSWTITFTNATQFTCAGANTGSVGSGQVTDDPFSPSNASGGTYFAIDASAWGGSWSSSETVTFDTHHAAHAIWVKETVPASTASYSNNNPTLRQSGESA